MRAEAIIAGARGRLVCAATSAPGLDAGDRAPPVGLERRRPPTGLGDRAVLKVYRQLEPGVNAEIELGLHLAHHPEARAAAVLGTIHYARDGQDPAAVAVVHAAVDHQGTAWDLVRGELEALLARKVDPADRRRARFTLTAVGRRVDRMRKGPVEAAVRRALARTPVETAEAYRALVRALVTELERPD